MPTALEIATAVRLTDRPRRTSRVEPRGRFFLISNATTDQYCFRIADLMSSACMKEPIMSRASLTKSHKRDHTSSDNGGPAAFDTDALSARINSRLKELCHNKAE